MPVSKRQLLQQVDRLNQIAGRPLEPWKKRLDRDGPAVANVGCFYLEWAYGGCQLVQMVTEGGGVVSLTGIETKPALSQLIEAFTLGYQYGVEDTCQHYHDREQAEESMHEHDTMLPLIDQDLDDEPISGLTL